MRIHRHIGPVRSLLVAVAASTALVGCASAPPTSAADQAEQQLASEVPSPPSSSKPSPQPEEANDLTTTLGETYAYDDGLAVTLANVRAFKPSAEALGTEGHSSFVVMDLTIENGTDSAFDPVLVSTSAQAGGAEASEVFDSTLGERPSTPILPGRKTSWMVAYGVDDPADLVVAVAPDFERTRALFASAGGSGK